MIELEAIKELSNLSFGYVIIGIVSIVVLGIITAIVCHKTNHWEDTTKNALIQMSPIFVAMIVFMTMIIIAITINTERLDLIEDYYEHMSCKELRETILNILKDDDSVKEIRQKVGFAKDLYQYSCEVPLRDEILKLQEDK